MRPTDALLRVRLRAGLGRHRIPVRDLQAAFRAVECPRDPFEVRLEELRAFHASHGHCAVPLEGADKALARWCRAQRMARELGRLTPAQLRALDALGFE